jgi:transcriptional regulator with XRE-family HTH domain
MGNMLGMRLAEYLIREGLSCAEFGRQVGLSTAQIHRLAHGKRTASLPVALRIAEATNDAVGPSALIALSADEEGVANDVTAPEVAAE